jgi:hypothetical protein
MNTVATDAFGAVITLGCKLAWRSDRYGICYGVVKRVTFTMRYGGKVHTAIAIRYKGPTSSQEHRAHSGHTVVIYKTKGTIVLRDDDFGHLDAR